MYNEKKRDRINHRSHLLSKGDGQKEAIGWPLSIRFFHWSLVLFVILTLVTSLRDQWLREHMVFGFVAFILVLRRLFYGFSGPFHTQFKNFIVSPKNLFNYLKKLLSLNPPQAVGHNPPHGWMILAFIAVPIVNFLFGLAVFWGEENEGLYSVYFSFRTGEFFKELHEGIGILLIAMIVLHLCGIAVDSWLHDRNIVKGMILAPKSSISLAKDFFQPRASLKFNALFAALLVLTTTLFFQTVYAKKVAPVLSLGGEGWTCWKEECSQCHELFHPSLLPESNWRNMMSNLASHFGEDASLEEEESKRISDFLTDFSAEKSDTEAAYKISKSIEGNQSILRITESGYWIKKHKNIEKSVSERKKIRSKTSCSSCHLDALSGGYADNNVRIPTT